MDNQNDLLGSVWETTQYGSKELCPLLQHIVAEVCYTSRVIEQIDDVMKQAATDINFCKYQRRNCRGPFPTINVGASLGSGDSVCFYKQ